MFEIAQLLMFEIAQLLICMDSQIFIRPVELPQLVRNVLIPSLRSQLVPTTPLPFAAIRSSPGANQTLAI